MNRWKLIGLTIVFLWFMIGGITHFTQPEFFVAIMPPYIGYHLPIVYGSGVLEILGALGILIPRFREWAGNGLFLLTILVTPANIHMWLHPELFPDVPEEMLSIRLAVQVLLLFCIWKSTRAASVADGHLT
ncbi:MAG: DoxX family protein [Pseudomonadales bacterium]